MIIYQSSKKEFIDHFKNERIENVIATAFKEKTGGTVGPSEIKSWKVSLPYMRDVISDEEFPDDIGVAIEYKIPQMSNRIDFILTGQDALNKDHAIVIELKQWDGADARLNAKDAMIDPGKFYTDKLHPSYQAWSYCSFLNGFNETVYSGEIELNPCAYLHSYIPDDVIRNEFYQSYLERSPVFLQGNSEQEKLRAFIKKFVKYGDKSQILYRIENSKIRPSKGLADSLSKMMKGNQEFVLIDDQKIIFEKVLAAAKQSSTEKKKVVIVEGGPGTGKSVVAINLLTATTKLGLNSRYVTKNAAPRAVFEMKLKGDFKKSEISNFFTGSGSFYETPENEFEVLIADEAHRLNMKSGLFKNKGMDQILEIIKSAKCSVFFLDEDQKVTLSDVGTKDKINTLAEVLGIEVETYQLNTQFRCNGSDGYLAWLDNTLQIHETANKILDQNEYDFKIIDSPSDLRDIITEKNKERNSARLLAGYCWDWKSKTDEKEFDIVMPEYNFKMQWNLNSDGSTFMVADGSVSEVGCIHTSQGLELDYIGVIVGDDFVIRNEKAVTNPEKRSKNDQSIKGYKKMMKDHPESAEKVLDQIIKNTYRTLMTRGMKGCYVYFVDKETEEWFKGKIN